VSLPRRLVVRSGEPLRKTGRRRGRIPGQVVTDVNGVRRVMFIQVTDKATPVMLYLHGGLPEQFLAAWYPNRLDEHFTLAWWAERDAGLSASRGIPRETLTAEQLVANTLSVTEFLRARFDKEKIFLMAHSGGTFIGLQAAVRVPELFSAYIGVAQVVHQLKSEMLAYEYSLRRFKQAGGRSMPHELEAAPTSLAAGIPDGYLAERDSGMHLLGVGTLWDEMLTTDLAKRVPQLAIPAYFLHGRYDYTVSYELARAYAAQVRAPLTGFYTFDRSADNPLVEEPARASRILLEDVLGGVNDLADAQVLTRCHVGAHRTPHVFGPVWADGRERHVDCIAS